MATENWYGSEEMITDLFDGWDMFFMSAGLGEVFTLGSGHARTVTTTEGRKFLVHVKPEDTADDDNPEAPEPA